MLTEVKKLNRGQALAEAFFFRADQELWCELRERLSREEKIKAFETLIGIRDSSVVECLVDAGFDLSAAMSFIWAPAMFVAWADGQVDDAEKQTILESLRTKGVAVNSPSNILEHEWFAMPPKEELWSLWVDFAREMLSGFRDDDRAAISKEIVSLCHEVARASGGLFGFAKASAAELEAIARIESALQTIS